jgi:hypothetical protein
VWPASDLILFCFENPVVTYTARIGLYDAYKTHMPNFKDEIKISKVELERIQNLSIFELIITSQKRGN